MPALRWVVGAMVLLAFPAGAGPSFDCALARTPDEQAICASPLLSSLDVALAAAHGRLAALYSRARATAFAAAVLRRRSACGSDPACIEAVQRAALADHAALGVAVPAPAADALPVDVGQCARSVIESLGGRLSGDDQFESGVAVVFVNGGYQVGYDADPAVIASRPGDAVEICLVSVPRNCPPGDDRGRIYRTTNLRTGAVWTLPDAQHECGGA